MIVTPEGLNVFPEDVEKVAERAARRSRIGRRRRAARRQHRRACAGRPGAVTRTATWTRSCARRTPRSRIISASALPLSGPVRELPRTEGTRKLKRRELRQWLAGQQPNAPERGAERRDVAVDARAVRAGTRHRAIHHDRRARPELARTRRADDGARGGISGDRRRSGVRRRNHRGGPRRRWSGPSRDRPPQPRRRRFQPRRGRDHRVSVVESIATRARVRRASLPTWILPLGRVFARITVAGTRPPASSSTTPVIFAANHQSHLDTPVILIRCRRRLRYRVAPAMAKEFFKAHFYPEQFGRRRVVHQQPELLSRRVFLQRVSAAAARSRHAPDAALHRRSDRRRLLGPDLSGGQADPVRRDRPVPAGHRDDRVAPRCSGRPGSARGARPHPPSHACTFPPSVVGAAPLGLLSRCRATTTRAGARR